MIARLLEILLSHISSSSIVNNSTSSLIGVTSLYSTGLVEILSSHILVLKFIFSSSIVKSSSTFIEATATSCSQLALFIRGSSNFGVKSCLFLCFFNVSSAFAHFIENLYACFNSFKHEEQINEGKFSFSET